MSDYHEQLAYRLRLHVKDPEALPEEIRSLLAAISVDYTDADRFLLQANAELRALFEAQPDLFVWFDDSGNVIREERGRDSERFPVATELSANPVIFRARRRTMETGNPVIVETRIELRGHEEHFEARFIPLLPGEVLGIIRNVTDRVRGASALAREKERLTHTLRSIDIAVVTTDRFGRVMLLNGVAEEILGLQSETAVGELLSEAVTIGDDLDLTPLRDRIDAVQATSRGWSVDQSTLTAANGRQFIIDLRAAPIIERSATDGVVIVFRDVSERVRLVDERLRSSKLESIGLLAGGVAHDFNNILQSLLGSLSLAEHRAKRGEDVGELIARARRAASRARDLTKQLLAVSKGGAPVKNVASIGELLHESSTFAARGKNVACKFEIADDLAAVEIDEGQMSQVIQNLVLNAAQAMPDGGPVVVGAENAGSEIRVYVTDRGVGISEEDRTKLFDPYFTTKESGSGLGLYTVYVVVKRHGGRINVDSELGVGTTFSVYLPVTTARTEAPRKAPRETPPRGGLGRVLVMDDEDAARRTTTEMLEYLGYSPEAASEGREAVELFESAAAADNRFDIALLDLTIPNGQGGAETVLELARAKDVPVTIAMTGYANDEIVKNFREHGFDAVLVKPFTVTELDQALRSAEQTRLEVTPSSSVVH